MKYTSTRDSSLDYTFEEALLSGYAPDGGLFVPENLPKVDAALLSSWSALSYIELAYEVLRRFISQDEIPDDDLKEICQSSFEDFPIPAVPVIQTIPGLYIAELFHGPTFCFKDMGMRIVVNLLAYFATKRKVEVTLLVSTTGDTGPAAVQAVKDVLERNANSSLSILVHYPLGQISEFQRKQLTTLQSDRIKVVAFQGSGDDMDAPIKRILAKNKKENGKRIICGVNSYNIGRPLAQMAHWIWTYLRVVEDIGVKPGDASNPVDVVVPTGAMGNIAGGYMAKCMGVPFGTLCAGVNINEVTHMAVETGIFAQAPVMLKTLSEAINIQLPYNFERLLYYLSDENDVMVKEWYTMLSESDRIELSKEWHEKLRSEFQSAKVTDDELCRILAKVHSIHGYIADPHTGIALCAAQQLGYVNFDSNEGQTDASEQQQKRNPVALMATASPCKFKESVTVALGYDTWEEYMKDGFPARAADIMQKDEIPPTLYEVLEGKSLKETQIEWEELAEIVIHRFK